MKPYDHLIPATLHEQILAAKADLEDENTSYTLLMNTIKHFIDDPSIDSCGIQALKRQFEDYLLVINAIITANSFDILEYGILDHQLEEINFEELNGTAVIIRVKEVLLKEYCDKQAEYYRDKYKYDVVYSIDCDGNFFGISHNEEYLRKAEAYEEESRQHQKNIDECDRIIGLYDNVEAMTSGLFQESVALRAQVTQALQSMGQSFVDGEYKAQVNQAWRTTLAHPKTQLLRYALLVHADVTPEQIANMEEKGYTPREILEMVKFCNDETNIHSETDRIFLGALMNGDYEKALQAYPGDLSDEMFGILADYATRLQPYDDEYHFVGDEEELERFLQAVWSAKGCYPLVNQDEEPDHLDQGEENREYLYRIASITMMRALEETMVLSTMDATDKDYDEKILKFYSARSAVDLWSTQYELTRIVNYQLDVTISDLDMHVDKDNPKNSYDDGQITFNISYYSGTDPVSARVDIESRRTGEELAALNDIIALQNAQNEYENAIKNGSIKAGFSFLFDVATNGGPTLAISAIKNTNSVFKGRSVAKKAVQELIQQFKIESFGGGTTFTIDSGEDKGTYVAACGYLDPGALRTIDDLCTNGMDLSRFAPENNKNKYNKDQLCRDIDADGTISKGAKEICYYYIKGADDTHPLNDLKNDFSNGTLNMIDVYKGMQAIEKYSDISMDEIKDKFREQSNSYGYFPN